MREKSLYKLLSSNYEECKYIYRAFIITILNEYLYESVVIYVDYIRKENKMRSSCEKSTE